MDDILSKVEARLVAVGGAMLALGLLGGLGLSQCSTGDDDGLSAGDKAICQEARDDDRDGVWERTHLADNDEISDYANMIQAGGDDDTADEAIALLNTACGDKGFTPAADTD